MNCEKNCDKKHNPKNLNKLNYYVAQTLWECKSSCSKKKSIKNNKNKKKKSTRSKKRIKK